jgi:predicted metal-dependent hydrolase
MKDASHPRPAARAGRPRPAADVSVTPRHAAWDFPADVPRCWFDGSPVRTRTLDVYTLLIPDNERYYIRRLKRSVDRIDDAAQKEELAAFFRQEALHGHAHNAYWANLQRDGIRTGHFTRVVNTFLYRIVEPVLPQRLHLANVAAIEHVNAYFGHIFLDRQLLRNADPRMRRLFEWHFAEEIEHKAVAFDALEAVYPGYATRLAGAALTFPLFYTILFAGTAWMLASQGELLRRRTLRDLYGFWVRDGVLRDSLRYIGRYLRPSFHPWDEDDYPLARRFFATFDTHPGG